MKTINNKFLLLFSLAIALVFTSCEKQENVMFTSEKGFVQLDISSSTSSIPEDSADSAVVKFVFGGDVSENTSGITVNFTVSTTDAARYTMSHTSTIEIPAGEYETQMTITPINNIVSDGNVTIDIILDDTGGLPVGLGGEGLEFVAHTVTIVDEDCPTIITTNYGAEVFAFGEEAPSHTVEFVQVPGTTNEWSLASAWGPNFVSWATGNSGYNGLYIYPTTIILNDDFTVTVTNDGGYATGGSGTYSACLNQFDVVITQALFNSPFTTRVVFTGK